MAKIRNKRTGEVRVVDESALPQYGISSQKEGFLSKIANSDTVDFLTAGTGRRIAQDIGTGLAFDRSGVTESQNQATLMAQKAMDRAQTVEDPEQKRRLLEVAGQTSRTVGADAKNMTGMFSEDIDKPALQRGLTAATEIATMAEIPGLVKTLAGLGKSAVKTVRGIPAKQAAKQAAREKAKKEILDEGLTTATKGKATRTAAIETAEQAGKKVDGNTVYRSIKEWAKDAKRGASTATKKRVDDYLRSARSVYKSKKLNPTTAKKAWDFASKSHSTSGKAGKTIEATYHGAIRDGVREALEKVAPGFEKGTALIKSGLDKEKVLKTIRTSIQRDLTKKELAKLEPLLPRLISAIKGPAKTAAIFKILSGIGL